MRAPVPKGGRASSAPIARNSAMKTNTLFLFAVIVALGVITLQGCSGSKDEGGVSTATPADKLDRPLPVDTAGGPPTASQNSGTLPSAGK